MGRHRPLWKVRRQVRAFGGTYDRDFLIKYNAGNDSVTLHGNPGQVQKPRSPCSIADCTPCTPPPLLSRVRHRGKKTALIVKSYAKYSVGFEILSLHWSLTRIPPGTRDRPLGTHFLIWTKGLYCFVFIWLRSGSNQMRNMLRGKNYSPLYKS